MSTIKVNKLENTATANGGISIDNTGHVQVDGLQMPTAGPLSNRNMVINGAMRVKQRGSSFTTTTVAKYTLDRWENWVTNSLNANSDITYEETDVPDGLGTAMKISPNATNTPTGSQNFAVEQSIEARNCLHLAYGTANAKDITVSFYAKSNKTGTYCVQLMHADGSTYVLVEYQVTNSWNRFEFTIPGNTADAIANDGGRGIRIAFHLACGPDDHAAATTTWTDGALFQATSNQVNFLDSTANEFYLTGVQCEVGSKATQFEHESYSQTLAKCLRYYQKLTRVTTDIRVGVGQAVSNNSADVPIKFVCEMRTPPTAIEQSGTASDYGVTSSSGGGGDNTSVPSFRMASAQSILVRFTDTGHLSAGNATQAYLDNTNAFLAWSAEL